MRMGLDYRPVIALLGAVGLIGCAPSHELVDLALQTNVSQSYPWAPTFAAQPERVYAQLVSVLEAAGARIVCREDQNRVVSWMTTSQSFGKLGAPSADPRLPWVLQSGRVHGTARVRRREDRCVVYLNCVWRHPVDSSVALSNGNYERRVLGDLAQRLGRSE
jgi:hypothetical protein